MVAMIKKGSSGQGSDIQTRNDLVRRDSADQAPNTATPSAPPTCRAVLSTAEAVPDLSRSTS